MVKAKKGKKPGKDEDVGDDEDVEMDSQAAYDKDSTGKKKIKDTGDDKEEKPNKKKEKKAKKQMDDNDDGDDVIEGKYVKKEVKKKGKKEKVKEESDDNDDEDSDVMVKKDKSKMEDDEYEAEMRRKKKDKKKSVDSNGDDDINNISKKVEEMEIKNRKKKPKKKADSDDEGSEEDNEVPSSKSKSKNQKPRGGFALLQVEDVESDDDGKESPARSPSPEEIIEKPKPQEKGGRKGKKNKRKKDDDDEEDIEKVLAELELEYSGQKPKEVDQKVEENEKEIDEKKADDKKEKKKKKKKDKDVSEEKDTKEDGLIEEDEEMSTVKTAAQKKKEKKEKAKKGAQKKEEPAKQADVPETIDMKTEKTETDKVQEDDEDDKKGKKDKKKKGKDKEKEEKTGKGPGKKTIAAMQEALKKIKEEEERMKREEEERVKKAEEAEAARLEALRIEKERKEKKKLKEKERKERLKAEGKLLTAKQKADKARAQAMINALKAQGIELPDPGEKKARPGTRVRPSKAKTQVSQESNEAPETQIKQTEEVEQEKQIQVEIVDSTMEKDEVKDAWDAESSEEELEEEHSDKIVEVESKEDRKETSEEESESEEDDDEEEEESSEEESDSEDDHKTEAEKRREKALARIQRRKEEAEKTRSLDVLRAAVVCVLGHVDTGKTKILDKLRRTNVQDGEAGGITQQIGATNVPIENIKENTRHVKGFSDLELKIPGLLIIDTPGHESFSNLRSRGSSLCDIAILVVDIMHGLEPQTLESINLLKQRKTPFIVALNKIDRLYDWQTMGRKDIRDIIKAQAENTQLEFKQRTNEVTVQFAEQGLNAALFYESPDIRSYVSLVPTSAITGEGMGNLLALIVEFSQSMLAKRLMYSDWLQATVLEVKAIPGLGTTIDVILINGKLSEGDTIIVAGTDAPIVTQIRSLLMPQPMKELRVKNAYVEYKEIKAAQGVKIAAKDLEKAIAGLNLQVADKPDEVEIFSEEVAKELKSALSSIKLKERGVYVQASTLGSLEALLEFLRTSKIPYSGIRIGPVVKKDVMKASIMLEHESQYATILAFDVKIERDAQELADSLGVKIFQADIIYHLFDKFMAYREELKQKKREEFKNIAVFPCKLKVLPQYVFNSRDPIVIGVMVEAGIVKEGTPICVPSKEFLDLGIVTSVEVNYKPVDVARKGMEVCIKIENVPGETPKMFGRHFDEKDMLTSKISRQSIDACKDYFRDDLTKADWQLMVELKKIFQIL